MFYAVGEFSGKVYGTGEQKCLLFQNLQRHFPSKSGRIYPEPLHLLTNHEQVINYKNNLT